MMDFLTMFALACAAVSFALYLAIAHARHLIRTLLSHGIPNAEDDEPLVASEPAFGPHQELPPGANSNAYYWVDIVVSNASSLVTFTGDGVSPRKSTLISTNNGLRYLRMGRFA